MLVTPDTLLRWHLKTAKHKWRRREGTAALVDRG
jgi:hypothetical protein